MNDDALKKLWQEQPSTLNPLLPDTGKIIALKQKLAWFDRAIHRRDLRENAVGILIILYYGYSFFRLHSLSARIGCFIILLSTSFTFWYPLWNKWRAPKPEPNTPVMGAIEIELQKVKTEIRLLKSVLWWYILPLSFGPLVIYFGAGGSLKSNLGYLLFVILLGAGINWLNQAAVRKILLPLKAELEALLDPEKPIAAPPPLPAPSRFLPKLLWFGTGCLCGAGLTLLWGLAAMHGYFWLATVTILIGIALLALLVAAFKSARARNFGAGVLCGSGVIFGWAYHLNSAPHAKAVLGTDIQQYLKDRVEKGKCAPGIVVGLLDEKGSRVFAYGKARDGSTNEVNGDTLFEIGSMTKVFTSLALADMVEHGEVKLDDPISKFLPTSVKVPARNGKQITLVDLATHTSGLPRLPGNMSAWYILRHADNPYAEYSVQELYDFLSGYALPREIGSKFEYSNLGVGLLGHVLALKAGTNYEALIEQRVCRPLGMTNTQITLTLDQQTRLAQGHNEHGRPVPNWDLPTLAGCGALRSSVNDLTKLLAANMGQVKTELQPAIGLTQQPRRDAGSSNMQIGLGWLILKRGDTEIVWHNGGTGGYRSYIGFNLKTRRGVVVLANAANDEIDSIGQNLLDSDR